MLNISLTAGGANAASYGTTLPAAWQCGMEGARSGSNISRSGSFVRLRRTKDQASQPWIHAVFRPCGNGLLCGNEYCRLCRSKTMYPAQRRQHGSMTEPFVLKMLQVPGKAEARSAVHTLLAAALRDRMPNRDSARRGSATPPLPVQPQLTCGVRLRWRRETCGPEHRGRPADTFGNKTL